MLVCDICLFLSIFAAVISRDDILLSRRTPVFKKPCWSVADVKIRMYNKQNKTIIEFSFV